MQDSIADGDFESGDDTEDDEISPSPLPSEHKAKSLLKTIFRPKMDESSFHGKSKYGKSASTKKRKIERLLQGLKCVSWEKVDVSFHNSKVRSAAHSVIQVKDPVMNQDTFYSKSPGLWKTDMNQDTSFANC